MKENDGEKEGNYRRREIGREGEGRREKKITSVCMANNNTEDRTRALEYKV